MKIFRIVLIPCLLLCLLLVYPIADKRAQLEDEFHILTQYYATPSVQQLFETIGKDFAIRHSELRREYGEVYEDTVHLFAVAATREVSGTYTRQRINVDNTREPVSTQAIIYQPNGEIVSADGQPLPVHIQYKQFIFQHLNLSRENLKKFRQSLDPDYQSDGQAIIGYDVQDAVVNVILGNADNAQATLVLVGLEATSLREPRQELVLFNEDHSSFMTESVYTTTK